MSSSKLQKCDLRFIEGQSDRISQDKNRKSKTVMIFELSIGGHYAEYIAHIFEYWQRQKITGKLYIVVSPLFFQQHSDIAKLAAKCNPEYIRLIAVNQQVSDQLKPHNNLISRNIRAWQEYTLASKYAKRLGAEHIFFPYFDTRQIPLILGKSLPCSYSGIYFRPSFHYQYFGKHRFTWKYQLQQWREKLTLSLVLKDSKLTNLFCLDPFAVKYINCLIDNQKANYLPDPVKTYDNSQADLQQMKDKLGIERSRQVYLLFGGIDSRKGLDQLLESTDFIPQNLHNQLCILVVGSINEKYYRSCSDKIDQLCQQTAIQIIIKNQYIPEIDIQKYFELADVVLALYQSHVGMSGIVNRAAATQRPVLSSNYGLMGEITRRYKLGLTVDSTSPKEIAEGLIEFLSNSPKEHCDLNKMKAFAEQNNPHRFAEVIFQHLMSQKKQNQMMN